MNDKNWRALIATAVVIAGLAIGGFGDSALPIDAEWAQQPELQLQLTPAGASGRAGLEVVGWTRGWLDHQASRLSPAALARALRVYTQDADLEDPTFPSMAGTVAVVASGLRFEPRYPWPAAEVVQVVVDSGQPSAGDWPRRFRLRTPAVEAGAPARLAAVYPSGDELPANQLKLYLAFSAPMTTWNPYRYLRLIDEASGAPLAAVFHDMRDGLWDPHSRRLTVVFDPGRIKRGLANHRRFGLPLTAGRSVRLEVSGRWPDAAGRPLGEGFVKRFRVREADRRSPSPSRWSLQVPAAGSREPVVVRFDEALDRALLERSFQLLDARGVAVDHSLRVGVGERSCELRPHRPWNAGSYRIAVDPALEDLAGNNLQRLFDVDLLADRASPASATPAASPCLTGFSGFRPVSVENTWSRPGPEENCSDKCFQNIGRFAR